MGQDAQVFSRRHLQLSDIGVRRVAWWRTMEEGHGGRIMGRGCTEGKPWREDRGGDGGRTMGDMEGEPCREVIRRRWGGG